MRALQLTAWQSGPEFQDVPVPEPGPGEVLVRVGGAGACHSDLHLLYEFPPGSQPYDPPFTLGHETAGWVEATGPGTGWLEQGQPVAVYGPWGCGQCYRCKQGAENYCERQAEIGALGGGLGRDGGMAPYLLVPSGRYLVPLADLSPLDAAPLTDAGLTPYHAIARSRSLLVPGTTVVVIGAGGGLGHMAVQILKALVPSKVVAVDAREEGLELARQMGADETVMASDTAADEVRALTKGRGAEVVLDFVGADSTMALAGACSRPLGHVTVVGLAQGTFPFSFFGLPYECSLATTYWGTLPELVEVLALAERKLIRPLVQRYSLDDAPAAYEALRAGSIQGRAVIVPPRESAAS